MGGNSERNTLWNIVNWVFPISWRKRPAFQRIWVRSFAHLHLFAAFGRSL